MTTLYEMQTLPDGGILFKPIVPASSILPAPPAESIRLNVPWLSQLSTMAGFAAGDCSMACAAMVLRSLGQAVTVDEVSRASGLKPGFVSAAWWDAVNAAARWHLVMEHDYNLTLDDLIAELRAARPAIVILNYQSIPEQFRYSKTYDAGHFVVMVGFNADHMLMHDPYWPDDRADRGAFVPLARTDFDRAWSTIAPGNQLGRQALRIKA